MSTYLVDLGHCDGLMILTEDDGDKDADDEQVDFWLGSQTRSGSDSRHWLPSAGSRFSLHLVTGTSLDNFSNPQSRAAAGGLTRPGPRGEHLEK